jgi:hypothetical protein
MACQFEATGKHGTTTTTTTTLDISSADSGRNSSTAG